MIKKYSLKNDGETLVSKNFKVKEFACHDGSDEILIDTDLVEKLQSLRDYLGKPLIILSAYRTENYNKSCGGASNSYHLKGMACDVRCDGVKPEVMAVWCEFNGLGGVGLYINRQLPFVHMDVRATKYRWLNDSGSQRQINNILDLFNLA